MIALWGLFVPLRQHLLLLMVHFMLFLAIAMQMLQVNPKYVLRNHLGELSIRQAKNGDYSMVQSLLKVLQSPFEEHPEHEAWAALAPDWAADIEISCSS